MWRDPETGRDPLVLEFKGRAGSSDEVPLEVSPIPQGSTNSPIDAFMLMVMMSKCVL